MEILKWSSTTAKDRWQYFFIDVQWQSGENIYVPCTVSYNPFAVFHTAPTGFITVHSSSLSDLQ